MKKLYLMLIACSLGYGSMNVAGEYESSPIYKELDQGQKNRYKISHNHILDQYEQQRNEAFQRHRNELSKFGENLDIDKLADKFELQASHEKELQDIDTNHQQQLSKLNDQFKNEVERSKQPATSGVKLDTPQPTAQTDVNTNSQASRFDLSQQDFLNMINSRKDMLGRTQQAKPTKIAQAESKKSETASRSDVSTEFAPELDNDISSETSTIAQPKFKRFETGSDSDISTQAAPEHVTTSDVSAHQSILRNYMNTEMATTILNNILETKMTPELQKIIDEPSRTSMEKTYAALQIPEIRALIEAKLLQPDTFYINDNGDFATKQLDVDAAHTRLGTDANSSQQDLDNALQKNLNRLKIGTTNPEEQIRELGEKDIDAHRIITEHKVLTGQWAPPLNPNVSFENINVKNVLGIDPTSAITLAKVQKEHNPINAMEKLIERAYKRQVKQYHDPKERELFEKAKLKGLIDFAETELVRIDRDFKDDSRNNPYNLFGQDNKIKVLTQEKENMEKALNKYEQEGKEKGWISKSFTDYLNQWNPFAS